MHKLEIIAKDVTECQKCELCKTRTNAVPGKGRFDADVMFVGEAPGRNEDNHGEPFVGAAGKRLDMILEDTGINREEVYITNIVKCRPPNNRVPSKKEEEACNGFINQEIEIINPKIICVMGNTAYGTLLGGKEITKNHGKIVKKEGRDFFVTFHPAATIYNQKLVDELKKDFKKFQQQVQWPKFCCLYIKVFVNLTLVYISCKWWICQYDIILFLLAEFLTK